MTPHAATLSALLARLGSTPLLMRSDCAHLPAMLFRRAIEIVNAGRLPVKLRSDVTDGEDDEPDADDISQDGVAPWIKREQIVMLPTGIAVVPVKGMVCAGIDDPIISWLFDLCRPEAIQAACYQLAERTDLRLVIFDIDSPGGYTTAVPETAAIMRQLSQHHNTLAFTQGMACSAAYWMASQCERIVCTPSSTVGSVGTYATIYDYSKMFEDAGIETHVLRAGTLKGIGVAGDRVTESQLAFLQSNVNKINASFLAAVKSGRGKLADEDLQGQWFDGDAAVEKGLADAVALNRAELTRELMKTI